MMEENWKAIPGYRFYVVSDLGRVKNRQRNKVLVPKHNQQGVAFVHLSQDGRVRTVAINRLVAYAFIKNTMPEIFDTVIYLDGDKNNICADNLEWRPRWYAINYHKQFPARKASWSTPVVELTSGEKFANSWDAAEAFGILDRDVWFSVTREEEVYIVHREFRRIS